ncbi:unnamed protein product, partial [Ectocarpus sp. 8 AP-2014]
RSFSPPSSPPPPSPPPPQQQIETPDPIVAKFPRCYASTMPSEGWHLAAASHNPIDHTRQRQGRRGPTALLMYVAVPQRDAHGGNSSKVAGRYERWIVAAKTTNHRHPSSSTGLHERRWAYNP